MQGGIIFKNTRLAGGWVVQCRCHIQINALALTLKEAGKQPLLTKESLSTSDSHWEHPYGPRPQPLSSPVTPYPALSFLHLHGPDTLWSLDTQELLHSCFPLLGKSCLVATLVAHVEVIWPFLSTQFLWTVIPSMNFLPWKATGGQSSAEIMWFLKVPPSTLGRQSYTVGGTVAAADSSLHLGKVYASCPFSLGNNSKSNCFKKKKKC